jgi:ribonuclease III
LQERLQASALPLPAYRVEQVQGEEHDLAFTVSCRVDGLVAAGIGQGASRRAAEQAAASDMLAQLDD